MNQYNATIQVTLTAVLTVSTKSASNRSDNFDMRPTSTLWGALFGNGRVVSSDIDSDLSPATE